MSREYWVIAAIILLAILLVTVAGRPGRPRESLFLFLVAQTVSWPATIIIVNKGFIASPFRLFPAATDSNFVLAFIFLPAVFVPYYWHYPHGRPRILRIAYTLAFAGASALVHVAVQKYTALIVYLTGTGYTVWLINLATYYGGRLYCRWYLDRLAKERAGDPI